MEDRTPTPGQEGRVLITPENGSSPFYAKVEMADNPTQEGTPLNKNSLLKDATAALFTGLPENPVPDEVFQILSKAALVGEDGSLNLPSGEGIKSLHFGLGYYYGTGNGLYNVSFEILPEIILVMSPSGEGNSNFAIIQKTSSGGYISAGFNYYQIGSKAMFSVSNCTVSGNSISMTGTSLGSGTLNQRGLLYNYFYMYYGVQS